VRPRGEPAAAPDDADAAVFRLISTEPRAYQRFSRVATPFTATGSVWPGPGPNVATSPKN